MKHKLDIRVHYPLDEGHIVLRVDTDWRQDIQPVRIRSGRQCFEFEFEPEQPYHYFKPVRIDAAGERWAVGDNCLALAHAAQPLDVHPYFDTEQHCSACELRELDDPRTGRRHSYRVFYPPGYHENTLRRYPVLYMQDGQNLFFAAEAFQGQHWRIAETLGLLDAMNAAAQVIVVGIYPNEREHDYTRPGYESYGRFLVERLKPLIDGEFRTLADPSLTAVMGSSLGGVVSFYLAWQYPQVFGMAGCMSSTFGWRDDLLERVRRGPHRPVMLYLDSGWPRDNYEVTRNMCLALRECGFRDGVDLHYLAFPQALHSEVHWAMRAHVPFQLFFGGARSGAAPTPAVEAVK